MSDILYIVITIGIALVTKLLSQHQMVIPLERQNPTTAYSYMEGTISNHVLALIAYGIPIGVLWFVHKFLSVSTIPNEVVSKIYMNKYVFIQICIALVASASTTLLFTEWGKIFAGRPRPHFYNRLLLEQTDDVYKSFPSGHASIIFNGMSFTSLFLCGVLKTFHQQTGDLWRLIICIFPLIIASFVALTRTRDYWHNFDDILAGSLIGSFSTVIVYLTKFEWLTSDKAGNIKGIEEEEVDENVLPM
ncbi:Lipid phosphate phosphatase [Entamoeba marina]